MTKGEAQRLMLRHCISINDMVQAGAPMVRQALVKHLMGRGKPNEKLSNSLEVFIARMARERDARNT